jgi:predicted kinase
MPVKSQLPTSHPTDNLATDPNLRPSLLSKSVGATISYIMNKPKLIVISGRPASGKTTLARILSREVKCPLLSRDELKEGYLNSRGALQGPSSKAVNGHINETFFQTIDFLLWKGVSLVVEAAFQHKLWQPKLMAILESADVRVIACETDTDLAKLRFAQRISTNPDRENYHGESLTKPIDEYISLLIEHFEPLSIEAPTLVVNTTENYNPGLENIIDFVQRQHCR